jgi:EF hand
MQAWMIATLAGASALMAGVGGWLMATGTQGAAPGAAPRQAQSIIGSAATAATPPAPTEPAAAPSDRRLTRYDKDEDGMVSRIEFLTNRQKAFTKLDVNGNGVLDFEEFAVKTATKFTTADVDGNGRLSADEFATTAQRRKKARAEEKAEPCVDVAQANE